MKQIFMAMLAAILLLYSAISSAASLSASYTATVQPDSSVILNVTVTNTGVDTVNAATLIPSGILADAAIPQIVLGNLTPGATASFQISASNSPGYLYFNGAGLDVLGNPVEFSVVGVGQ